MNTVALWIGWAMMVTAGLVLAGAVVYLVALWGMGRILFLMDGARAFYDFCRARGRERAHGPSNARNQGLAPQGEHHD